MPVDRAARIGGPGMNVTGRNTGGPRHGDDRMRMVAAVAVAAGECPGSSVPRVFVVSIGHVITDITEYGFALLPRTVLSGHGCGKGPGDRSVGRIAVERRVQKIALPRREPFGQPAVRR